MAALKDNINEMIRNLKDTTLKNTEQDWLKTNLARFTRMLQGERDLVTVTNLIMSELAPLVNAQYGVFYVTGRDGDETVLELVASYGAESREVLPPRFALREGLVGQCAADKRKLLLTKVPSGLPARRLRPRRRRAGQRHHPAGAVRRRRSRRSSSWPRSATSATPTSSSSTS